MSHKGERKDEGRKEGRKEGERVKVISVFGIDRLHDCVPPSLRRSIACLDTFCEDREGNPQHARARATDGGRRASEMNHFSPLRLRELASTWLSVRLSPSPTLTPSVARA